MEWIGTSLAQKFDRKMIDIYDLWIILNLLYDSIPRLGINFEGDKFILNGTVPTVLIWAEKQGTMMRINTQISNKEPLTEKFRAPKLNMPVSEIRPKVTEKWLITKKGIVWEHAKKFKHDVHVKGLEYPGNNAIEAWIERSKNAVYMVTLEGEIWNNRDFYPTEVHITEAKLQGEDVEVMTSHTHSRKINPLKIIAELGLK